MMIERVKIVGRIFRRVIICSLLLGYQLSGAIAKAAEKDDTDSLQRVLNNSPGVVRLTGTYLINRTLIVPSGVEIIGGTIQSGSHLSGTLETRGIYLKYIRARNNKLINVRFEGRGGFKLAQWGNAVVFLDNCDHVQIRGCIFHLDQAYGPIGSEAVWITGEQSVANEFIDNQLYTTGIEYAENGADSSLIKGNLIINAHADAICGHGNGKTSCKNNVILQNTIKDAGYMGIEDWGNCDGTLISGNQIRGTGKCPQFQREGIGVSAVGINTIVTHNYIKDAQLYYIESGGNHHIDIAFNQIDDAELQAVGIIANVTAPPPPNVVKNEGLILHNMIKGTMEGIQVFGDYTSSLLIDSNTISDPGSKGIDINSDADCYDIGIVANIFYFNSPALQKRIAILAYTKKENLQGQHLVVKTNRLTYGPATGSSVGGECVITLGTNYTSVLDNKIMSRNKKLIFMSTIYRDQTGGIVRGNSINSSTRLH